VKAQMQMQCSIFSTLHVNNKQFISIKVINTIITREWGEGWKNIGNLLIRCKLGLRKV